MREPPCSTPPSARAPALNEDLVVTPNEFITKWRASELKERSASQEHFIDLCRLLGEPTPADADPTGETYCFERGARRDAGGDGWADVWKRHHFAWEYKGRRANLDAAFNQLRQYALALENPPLLIVSDMVRFRIRTNWTNSVSRTHEFELDDLADAATRDRLKWAFSDPERLRPGETRQSLTERVAASFASVAQALRERGHDPPAVAHFVNRLVFCMFADDVGLLPDHMFTRMLRHALPAPARFGELAGELFRAMAAGGRVGFETVAWFNGSLFNDATTLPLERTDIETVLAASDLDWSEVDPSILGTLFERGLDPGKRAQLGAHYTDRDKIMLLVEPVVVRPLLAEWDAEKTEITAELERAEAARSPPRPHEAAERGRAAVPGVSQPAARIHGARPGLRLGQLPVPGPAGAQGPRASGPARGRGAGFPPGVSGDRPGQRQGHRDQPLRGGAGARVGLDRRDPVDAAQRLRGSEKPDPETPRHHRVPGRDPDAGQPRAGVACSRRRDWQPGRSWATSC